MKLVLLSFLESQSRIIFNMSHPVTFKDRNGNKNLTSEFVSTLISIRLQNS